MSEIKLGQTVKCVVTDAQGTATSITQYLHGCRRIGVQAKIVDGKVPDAIDIDEPQLTIVDSKQVIKTKEPKEIIKLGQEAIDPITGYSGIVIGRCIFINGCARVGIQKKYNPDVDKEFCGGKWFYENQIKIVEKKVAKEIAPSAEARKTGGPGMMSSYKHDNKR